MDEDPKHLPPFLRDFHDQKDFFKAFYVWLEMIDNKSRAPSGRLHGKRHLKRRPDLCTWPDFHVLVISLLDFLNMAGWRVCPARGAVMQRVDLATLLKDLAELDLAWLAIVEDAPLTMSHAEAVEVISRWQNWKPYMPQQVLERLAFFERADQP